MLGSISCCNFYNFTGTFYCTSTCRRFDSLSKHNVYKLTSSHCCCGGAKYIWYSVRLQMYIKTNCNTITKIVIYFITVHHKQEHMIPKITLPLKHILLAIKPNPTLVCVIKYFAYIMTCLHAFPIKSTFIFFSCPIFLKKTILFRTPDLFLINVITQCCFSR